MKSEGTASVRQHYGHPRCFRLSDAVLKTPDSMPPLPRSVCEAAQSGAGAGDLALTARLIGARPAT